MGLMDILNQYAGLAAGTAAPEATDHFGSVAQEAPREELAHGLAAAFRADETPPFEQMVGQLFGRSDPQQRAGLLNELLRSIGPAAASGALGTGILSGILRRPNPQISPQEAAQVNSAEVQDLARHA